MSTMRGNILSVHDIVRLKRIVANVGSYRLSRAQIVSLSILVATLFWNASLTRAQQDVKPQFSDDYVTKPKSYDSAENIGIELKIGPYNPDVGNDAFKRTYPNDDGLLLRFELDVIAYRLKDVLYLNVGGGFGWADYKGPARNLDTGSATGEKDELEMFPLSLVGVFRVDALARLLDVPLIFAGKFGYIWFIWDNDKGGADMKNGISHGLVWATQAALDLDFFDESAARMLDDEWGINHSYLFFEVLGTNTLFGLPLDDITWSLGLGLIM
jgi:hypothetical protein